MNKIYVTGIINKIEYDHTTENLDIYSATLHTTASGDIQIMAPAGVLKTGIVNLSGQLRSHNADGHVNVYVYATGYDKGVTEVSGRVCVPVYEKTTRSGVVSNFILAINRSHGKCAFVPCVVFDHCSLSVGEEFRATGRIRCRQHAKGSSTEFVVKDIIS